MYNLSNSTGQRTFELFRKKLYDHINAETATHHPSPQSEPLKGRRIVLRLTVINFQYIVKFFRLIQRRCAFVIYITLNRDSNFTSTCQYLICIWYSN